MPEMKLETRYPSHQNAVDLFGDRWLIRLEEIYPGLTSGPDRYLRFDHRPGKAATHLGFVKGSLHGMSVLELGPREGAHTYQLARLGADSVLAIEANSDAYLRCLVTKEILRPPNCRFLLGDGVLFLQQTEQRFDLIFCSGMLYHMEDPVSLIEAMCRRTDRIFLWTHYVDPEQPKGPILRPTPVVRDGLELTYHQHAYNHDIQGADHAGGLAPLASWMTREDIARSFARYGFILTIVEDDRDLASGHNITAVARRDAPAA